MARRIEGRLLWARALPSRPSCIPQGRPRGAKRLGLLYEGRVREALPLARWGQWFEYEDSAGRHFCQTDAILPHSGGIACLEVKLGWTALAEEQLFNLYLPVLSKASGREVWAVVVCQYLRGASRPIGASLKGAIGMAKGMQPGQGAPIWHLDPRIALRAPSPDFGVGKSAVA